MFAAKVRLPFHELATWVVVYDIDPANGDRKRIGLVKGAIQFDEISPSKVLGEFSGTLIGNTSELAL